MVVVVVVKMMLMMLVVQSPWLLVQRTHHCIDYSTERAQVARAG